VTNSRRETLIADIAAQAVIVALDYDLAANPDGWPQFLFDLLVATGTYVADKTAEETREHCWKLTRYLGSGCGEN
jgi:hypothetical protein